MNLYSKNNLFGKAFLLLITPVLFFSISISFAQAESGVPSILSYQGRLTDSGGNLLGGAGTPYFFKFSFWDSATVGSGSQVWPIANPAPVSLTVKQGVFNVNIGDIENSYPDILNYNFGSNKKIYLQVEASANNSSFETLSPRQRITSAPFAEVAGSLTPDYLTSIFSNYFTKTESNNLYDILGTASTTASTTITNHENIFNHNLISTALQSFTELDPVWSAASTSLSVNNFATSSISQWLNDSGYLTSFSEADPFWNSSSWSTTTNNSANWNTAFGWGNHAGLYDLLGTASTTASSKQDILNGTGFIKANGTSITYDNNTYLTAETDPLFTAWDKHAGISVTESQISDLGSYITSSALTPYALLDGTNQPFTGNITIGASSAFPYRLLVSEAGVTPEDSAVLTTDLLKGKAISVQGDGAAYYMGRDVTNNIEFIMGTSNAGAAFSGSVTNHPLQLRTNNTTKFTIGIDGTPTLSAGTDGTLAGILNTTKLSVITPTVVAGINPVLLLKSNSVTTNDGVGIDFVGSTDSSGVTARIGAIRKGSGGFGDFTISTLPSGGSLTERMRINKDGYVGIGINAPTSLLHIVGSADIPQFTIKANATQTSDVFNALNSAGNKLLSLSSSGALTVSAASTAVVNTNTVGSLEFYTYDVSAITNRTVARIKAVAEGDYIGTDNAKTAITFETHGTSGDAVERMRISNAGNVGIGTTAPSFPLEIINTAQTTINDPATSGLSITNTVAATNSARRFSGLYLKSSGWNSGVAEENGAMILIDPQINNNPTFYVRINRGGTLSTVFSVDYAGYITTPIRKSNYQPGAVANEGMYMPSGGSATAVAPIQYSPYIQLEGDAWDTTISSSKQTLFRIYVTPISGATAASSLDFFSGIGTTNPSLKIFSIANNGDVKLVRDNAKLYFGAGNDASITYNGTDLLINPSEVGSGKVGIGTTTPTQALTVAGNAQFTAVTSGAFSSDLSLTADGVLTTSASDASLKMNLEALGVTANGTSSVSILDKVMGLKPYKFNWISDPTGSKDIGLVAQDVEGIFPEITFTNKVDGYKGINYSRLPVILVSAIQELNEKVSNAGSYVADGVANFVSVIATKFTGEEAEITNIKTQEVCIGETCIDEAMLKEIILKNSISNTGSNPDPVIDTPITETTGTSTATSTATTTDTVASTTETIASTTPEIIPEAISTATTTEPVVEEVVPVATTTEPVIVPVEIATTTEPII